MPPSTTEDGPLWRWSARQLAESIATGLIGAREATQSCLDRIEAINPTLNALATVCADEAVAAAELADRQRAAGAPLGPLHGVPVTIKVNSDQRGHATTDGVVAFSDDRAPDDSPQVANLRRAGAIIVGRSNTPAFSVRWFTDNDLHGRTLNPWDPDRTPGGSSGGAAAAVAAGMAPIGQGNDVGGSVRYPAYACGLVGLRPTPGRVAGSYGPRETDVPMTVQSWLVQGPLARSVDDVRLALCGLSGYDVRDPVAIPGEPAAPPAPAPVRVGLVRDFGAGGPSPAVDAALDAAAGWLTDAGYRVEPVELPLLAEAYRLWCLLCFEEMRALRPTIERLGDAGVARSVALNVEIAAQWWGRQPSLDDYIRGYARRGTLIRQLGQFLVDYPFVLLPVSAEPAFPRDFDTIDLATNRRILAAQASMMAVPLLGFPALAVPTGVADGLPMGVQLIGRRFDEQGLLTVAEAIEARAGTLTPIDPRGPRRVG